MPMAEECCCENACQRNVGYHRYYKTVGFFRQNNWSTSFTLALKRHVMASLKNLKFSNLLHDCFGNSQLACIDRLRIGAIIIIPTCIVAGAIAALSIIIPRTDNYWPGAIAFLIFALDSFLLTSKRVSEGKSYLALQLIILISFAYSVYDHDQAAISREETWRQVYAGFLVSLGITCAIPIGIVFGLFFPKGSTKPWEKSEP